MRRTRHGHKRAEQMRMLGMQRSPSAHTLARLMTAGRDHLTEVDTVILAVIEVGVPNLAIARMLVEGMIRSKVATDLGTWLEQARASLGAPLAVGVARDVGTIRAAITEPWSNG